jgi:hypothetical protein
VLLSPVSRYGEQMKAGPCGLAGGQRTALVTTVRPGDVLTVSFSEIIDHPGYFRIAFDPAGDDDLAPPVWSGTGTTFVNPANVMVLADLIPNPPGLTHHDWAVTLPDLECDTCTLQLIQVMTDKPPYDGVDDFYYQCADLQLSATLPVGGPTPGQPPAPTVGSPSGGCATGAGESWLGVLVVGLLALRPALVRRPAPR